MGIRIAMILLAWGLVTSVAARANEPLAVYTVNYPLQYFAQRIAADHAEVSFPAPPDVDPAFWMPDTETIQAYQRADLVLLNGAGYARWIKKASLPRLRQVNTSAAFEHAYIPVQKGVTHSHGHAGDHSQSGRAVTTWLDIYQAEQQAANWVSRLPTPCTSMPRDGVGVAWLPANGSIAGRATPVRRLDTAWDSLRSNILERLGNSLLDCVFNRTDL